MADGDVGIDLCSRGIYNRKIAGDAWSPSFIAIVFRAKNHEQNVPSSAGHITINTVVNVWLSDKSKGD